MKLEIRNSLKRPFSLVTTVLFSLVILVFSVQAQNVNDDLKPKPKPKPTKTRSAPANNPKPVRRRTRLRKRTTAPARTSGTSSAQTSKTAAAANSDSDTDKTSGSTFNSTSEQQFGSADSVKESAAEIIERFMTFHQTSTVTIQDWRSAAAQAKADLKDKPNDETIKAQLFVAQAELALNVKDYSNALIHFNAAAQVLPKSSLPYYGIGTIYLVTKQPEQAEDAFEKAVKLNKNFALAYKGLGDTYTAQRKPKKAQEYYQQAAKLGLAQKKSIADAPIVSTDDSTNTSTAGTNQNTPTKSEPSTYDLELRNARQLTARKKWEDSLQKLDALSKEHPTTEVYLLMGDNYSGMEQWLSAHQAYQKATKVDPKSALAFYRSGMVLYELNEYQSASESFEKALILDINGKSINRSVVRKMADKAAEKARN